MADAIREILSVPKPSLSELSLSFISDLESSVDALKELDYRARSVHDFSYRGGFPEDDAFEAFVDGAPLLENVLIFFTTEGPRSRTWRTG